ncbi:hypothetical protein KXW60_000440 [Aspergillus fumigatus]|nr:hypothetical protein KXX42_004100 [Aspergillus fumigatus]KAH1981911.1 hypothetical protein KXW88_005124 [Aspergillus fumigatus]KAH2748026.1 hypothetical protein KXV94_004778 [Aspergillus fumigatus]KAH3010763.1 hypothetical protein KXW60_000440 [Aspergillus fumigatus]KAH3272399.1 hypothetical protein KXW55_000336 [Aspergillus fumigatus]
MPTLASAVLRARIQPCEYRATSNPAPDESDTSQAADGNGYPESDAGRANQPIAAGAGALDRRSPSWESGSMACSSSCLEPNFTTLSGRYCADAPRVTLVVAPAARKEPPFDTRPMLQRLKTLHIISNDVRDVYSHWQFPPFFHLPSLRNVNMGTVKEYKGWTRLNHPAVSSTSGKSPVASLVLESHCNGRDGVAEFITSCANLKEFRYQHDDDEDWAQTCKNFQPQKIYKALLTQKHSLEVLHLSHNVQVSRFPSDDKDENGPVPLDLITGRAQKPTGYSYPHR